MKRLPRNILLLIPLWLVTVAWIQPALADSQPAPVTVPDDCGKAVDLRPQDSLWMINTRHLSCANPKDPESSVLHYFRYEANQGWQPATAAEFQADYQEHTVFYVHGNRVDRPRAEERGHEAYQALTQARFDAPPIRFVVWSWPSDRLRGPRKDVLVKAYRTNAEGVFLARVLNQMPAETRLALFGFSFGARIISGALHLQAGGLLCGYRLPEDAAPAFAQSRIVVMAAAMHRSWWLPGGFHEQCPQAADAMLVQYNSCDPVLKLYPRIDRRRRPQALGYTGFPWPNSLPENSGRLEQQNAAREIGKTHSAEAYFENPTLMNRASQVLLWNPLD